MGRRYARSSRITGWNGALIGRNRQQSAAATYMNTKTDDRHDNSDKLKDQPNSIPQHLIEAACIGRLGCAHRDVTHHIQKVEYFRDRKAISKPDSRQQNCKN